MNYKQIIGVFSRKTQLKNVENIRLNDGKIEINFLKSIVRSISERCFRTEFSPRSRYAWNWNNVSIGTIARLLSVPRTWHSHPQSSGLARPANRKKRHCSGPKYWPRAPVPKP